mmetsp:Transcript_29138/g.35509  ORF Transcript_29138/g.35509 Transcript_29138/m.35509 type:complete len:281 (+) Transcript_29138:123-965(+)
MRLPILLLLAGTCPTSAFTPPLSPSLHPPTSIKVSSTPSSETRRAILFTPLLSLLTLPSPATATDLSSSDLPMDAVRSYLQYRVPLQISADYYIFELKKQLDDLDSWGEVNSLFSSSNARGGQGQPSKIERDFINPMRIVSLSMPPDEAEEMRDAQYKFEAAMDRIRKVVSGVRRDLPVEISPTLLPQAQKGWDDGRVALNSFFIALNSATGLKDEMKVIPSEKSEYGRSERKYVDLKKKIKLCQNRGGPTLSNAWGQLMVSGYLQDSCGIPDLDGYFYQ